MQFLRKLGLGLALFLYAPLLLILPTVISLNATLNKPDFIKETLVEAKLYPALSTYVLEQIGKSSDVASNPLVGQAANEVFTPEAIQEIFEPTVDSIYGWLDNPDQKFDISLSTKPLQDAFKARLDQTLVSQLNTLPPCSARVQPTSTDPFKLNCIPSGMTIDSIRAEAQAQINQNQELAKQETISLTENNEQLIVDEAPAASAGPDASVTEAPQLNADQFRMLAKLYQITKASTPWIIGLLVLGTGAILFLSRPWVSGMKRIGIFLIVNGGLLFIGSAGSSFLLGAILPTPATDGSIGTAGREVANLLTKHMIATTRSFAIAYVILGILGVIAAIILKKKLGNNKPSELSETQDLTPKYEELAKPPQEPESNPRINE